MSTPDDQLAGRVRQAAAAPSQEVPLAAIRRRAGRRRLRRRGTAMLGVAVVLLAAVGVAGQVLTPRVLLTPSGDGSEGEGWPLRVRYEVTSFDLDTGEPFEPVVHEFAGDSQQDWLHVTAEGATARAQRVDEGRHHRAEVAAPGDDAPFALLAAAAAADFEVTPGGENDGAPVAPGPLFNWGFGEQPSTQAWGVIADDLPTERAAVAERLELDADALIGYEVEQWIPCPGQDPDDPLVDEDCFQRYRVVALPAAGIPLLVEESHSAYGREAVMEVTHLDADLDDAAVTETTDAAAGWPLWVRYTETDYLHDGAHTVVNEFAARGWHEWLEVHVASESADGRSRLGGSVDGHRSGIADLEAAVAVGEPDEPFATLAVALEGDWSDDQAVRAYETDTDSRVPGPRFSFMPASPAELAQRPEVTIDDDDPDGLATSTADRLDIEQADLAVFHVVTEPQEAGDGVIASRWTYVRHTPTDLPLLVERLEVTHLRLGAAIPELPIPEDVEPLETYDGPTELLPPTSPPQPETPDPRS